MSENENRKELAKVINVFDYDEKVVINRGEADGVEKNDTYLIYEIGEEMFDLENDESLGRLEIVKGKGKVIHVQEKIATIESTEKISPQKKTIKRKNKNSFIPFESGYEEEVITDEETIVAFNNPKRGDFAKLIE